MRLVRQYSFNYLSLQLTFFARNYLFFASRTVIKQALKKLPIKVRQDLLMASKNLETDPYAGEKLTGPLSFLYSFHFKSQNVDYRMAYTINLEEKLIIVYFAHTRENFYEKLRRLFK